MEYNTTDLGRISTIRIASSSVPPSTFAHENYSGYLPSTPLANRSWTGNAIRTTTLPPSIIEETSAFALWQIVIIGILVGALSLATVSGNCLVLISFYVERAIRQPTNYFIASLAVSDLLIGLLSMPLYTQYLIVQEWKLGEFVCDLWLSLDYTVCLASQYTVLLITIDRFCSVKFPALYRAWRTEQRVRIMVVAAWFIPGGLFFTCIIGWQYFVGERKVRHNQCEVQFLQNPVFNTALIFAYYWSSLIVLCILYGCIYRVAYELQKRSEAKHRKTRSMVEMAGGTMTKVGIGISKTQSTLLSAGGSAERQNISSVSSQNALSTRRVSKSETSFASKPEDQNERSSSPTYPSDDEDSSSEQQAKKKKKPKSPMHLVKRKKPKEQKPQPVKPTKPRKHKNIAATEGGKVKLPPGAERKPLRVSPPNNLGTDMLIVGSYTTLPDSPISDIPDQPTTPPPRLQPVDEHPEIKSSDYEQLPDSKSNCCQNNIHCSGFDINAAPEGLELFSYIDQESLRSPSSDSIRSPVSRQGSRETTPGLLTGRRSKESTPASVSGCSREPSPRVKEGSPTVVTTTPSAGTVTRIATKADEEALLKETSPPRYDGEVSVTTKNGKVATPTPPERGNLLKKPSKNKNNFKRRDKREKSKSENRARKALRTITCIMGAFVLCWTPWHVFATVMGFCPTCISPDLYAFSYWLCYMNSPLNPFMYALANVQFKKTFIRLLRGDFERR